MSETIKEYTERVLLVGVDSGEDKNFDASMKELMNLSKANEYEPVGMITQKMDMVNKGLYIGTGKVSEVREYAAECEADMVIFNDTLSPAQLKNLQDNLSMPVMDRTGLILEIFSSRAQTREAKLQVETARLQYLLPRLIGMHDALSRQGGASGSMSNKGAGEKKLELDRRKIEHRITEMKKELEEVAKERVTQRKKRTESCIPQVSLVGYTNAGKSTIMNRMVERYLQDDTKKVLEKDMLFATLETSVRKIDTGRKRPFFLADTVGFIHKLPHGLVKAFRSTLEEVCSADLLLHVVDYSDEQYKQHIEVTEETLRELGAGGIPVIYVYNKTDLVEDTSLKKMENKIFMSAKNQECMNALVEMIEKTLYSDLVKTEFLFPYDKGSIVSYLNENAEVLEQNYIETGIHLVVNCHQNDITKYSQYIM